MDNHWAALGTPEGAVPDDRLLPTSRDRNSWSQTYADPWDPWLVGTLEGNGCEVVRVEGIIVLIV